MGPLAKLMMLLRREAPAQTDAAREAMRQAARGDREAALVGSVDIPTQSRIVVGQRDTVVPDAGDRARALASGRPILDFHTHPAGYNEQMFGVSPSARDLDYYIANYPERMRPEMRVMIAAPPTSSDKTAYSFFATDEPRIFSPSAADAARLEMQEAARRGRFRPVVDDSLFRDYFSSGGDLSVILEDVAPLALLRRRAQQGRGRQEMLLPSRGISTDPRSTPAELFRRMEPTMMDILREKKFARGGLNKVKECACG